MIYDQYDSPFPHTVVDGFLSPQLVEQLNNDFDSVEWYKKEGKTSFKLRAKEQPKSALDVIDSIDISKIEQLTGITGLFKDPELFGAGLHCIPRGGFLKMHCDFNLHPKGWLRRVNVLIYLNRVWRSSWGGQLQLGLGENARYIEPIGGRCVIFETNEVSWHGHPEPLVCPTNVQRRSLALYLYTTETTEVAPHTTIYHRD